MRDAVGAWLDAAGRYPLLTPAEELHLGALVQTWQRWDGGPDAAPAPVQRRGLGAGDRMVRGNLRLVASVARRYSGLIKQRGLSLADGAAEYLVPRAGRSFAELEQLVLTIDRISLERQVPATMSVWRAAIEALQGPEQASLL